MNNRFYFRVWTGTQMLSDVAVCNGVYVRADWSECIDFILMQCTGLKDKNGKLIYEGDIIKTSKGIANVEYDNTYAYFGLTNFLTVFSFDNFINEEIEVIGNIYENKELLEEE